MSAEPSMEEILSSIKRIIAEEGESPVRGRRVGRATPPPPPAYEDDAEVLELDHPIPPVAEPIAIEAPVRVPVLAPLPPVTPPPAAVEPTPPAAVVPPMPEPAAEPILSTQAAAASRTSLDSLSKLMVKPEPSGDGTLEGMVREMLRPMLRDWLDANLPAMVETMVQAEIARITGQQG